ncbi:hypothetical protein BDW75DRAFT_159125 [Aspergillus navahoensis]
MQASLSSASEPMFQSSWLSFQPFHVINDVEIQMFSRKGLSETTFFCLLSLAQETTRYLTVSNSTTPYTNDIHKRQQLVHTFKRRIDELIFGLQPEHVDFHWYLEKVAHSIALLLQLLALRPMKKAVSLETCSATDVNLLKLAVGVLDSRCRVYRSKKTEPWQWLEPLFFPWQALVIALAEVRACDDLSLLESVWPCIEENYARFITFDNESPQPWLRKSVNELIEQARRSHERMLLSVSNDTNAAFARISLPSAPPYQPSYLSTETWTMENVSASPTPLPAIMIPEVDDFASWFDDCGDPGLFSIGA